MRNGIVPLIDMDETFQQNISPVFVLCFRDIIPAAPPAPPAPLWESITIVWKCFPQSCLSIKFSENLLYFECFHMNEHVTMLAGIVLISAYKQWTVSYPNLFDFTEFNEFHLLK